MIENANTDQFAQKLLASPDSQSNGNEDALQQAVTQLKTAYLKAVKEVWDNREIHPKARRRAFDPNRSRLGLPFERNIKKDRITDHLLSEYLGHMAQSNARGYAAAFIGFSSQAIALVQKVHDVNGILEAFLNDAKDIWLNHLEEHAHKLAVIGVNEAVYHQGLVVGYRKRYDTGLLVKLLTKVDPKGYGNKVDVEVNDTKNVLEVPMTVSPEESPLVREKADLK